MELGLYFFYTMLLHDLHGFSNKGTGYPALPPILTYTQHRDVASIRMLSMHALLTHNDADRIIRRRLGRVCEKRQMGPLMQKVAESVYDIGLDIDGTRFRS